MVTGPSNPQYPYVRANSKKVQPSSGLEPFRACGINLYLIDSPDFSGLGALSRRGLFSAGGQTATLSRRPQLALQPAHRPVGFKGSSRSHLASRPSRLRSPAGSLRAGPDSRRRTDALSRGAARAQRDDLGIGACDAGQGEQRDEERADQHGARGINYRLAIPANCLPL
ncbi:MAG: hypothetical protein QOI05_1605 [Bradyrhizobium sp.]|nr:hypothetical protein [Bradyrhizobium sp.]